MYIDKDLIEDRLYQIIDQFNERKIKRVTFYWILQYEIHRFYDRNGKTCKIQFTNGGEINLLMGPKMKKLNII